MTRVGETVSRHFLRRTARAKERLLEATEPGNQYTVQSFVRGPFGWRVVRLR